MCGKFHSPEAVFLGKVSQARSGWIPAEVWSLRRTERRSLDTVPTVPLWIRPQKRVEPSVVHCNQFYGRTLPNNCDRHYWCQPAGWRIPEIWHTVLATCQQHFLAPFYYIKDADRQIQWVSVSLQYLVKRAADVCKFASKWCLGVSSSDHD